MMPPTNLSATELFEQIIAVPRPHRIVDFPRNNADGNPLCEVALLLLSQHDSIAASAAAQKTAKKLLADSLPGKDEKSRGYDDVYNNSAVIEILFRACKNPHDITKSFFPSKDSIGSVLTADEIGILFNHYLALQVELGPILSHMTEEEMDAWVKRLAEGGERSQYFLSSFTWEALKMLTVYMASLLHNLQTGNASLGTPQEDTKANE